MVYKKRKKKNEEKTTEEAIIKNVKINVQYTQFSNLLA